MSWTKVDYSVVIGLFILALILRWPQLAQAPRALFDEPVQAVVATHILYQQPYFDAHPPLAAGLLATIAKPYQPALLTAVDGNSRSFDNFPYLAGRRASALLGAALVAAVYVLARGLGHKISQALVVAWLVTWDNALIVYSRLILPDGWLLFFGFTGLATVVAANWVTSKMFRYFLFILGAISLGAALSVKWTALAFLAALGILAWRRQPLKYWLLATALAWLVHLLVWGWFFNQVTITSNLPSAVGRLQPMAAAMRYPKGDSLITVMEFLPSHFANMIKSHSLFADNNGSSQPWQWPLGEKRLGLLIESGRSIIVQGNPVAWLSVVVAVLVALVLAGLSVSGRLSGAPLASNVLLLAFLINYLPFWFINRALFIYHYFPALIFGYLLVPLIFSWLKDWCIKSEYWRKRAVVAYLYAVVIAWLLLAPTTYGFTWP